MGNAPDLDWGKLFKAVWRYVLLLVGAWLALRYCSPVLLLKEGRIVERLEPRACTAPQMERALGLLYPGIRVKEDKETGHLLCTIE